MKLANALIAVFPWKKKALAIGRVKEPPSDQAMPPDVFPLNRVSTSSDAAEYRRPPIGPSAMQPIILMAPGERINGEFPFPKLSIKHP